MPIELLIKEIKNLFGVVDSNFKALMNSTLTTRRATKKWVTIVCSYAFIPYNTEKTFTLYKNTRKTDIILNTIAYEIGFYLDVDLYTKSAKILTTVDLDGGTSQPRPILHENRFTDIDLVIHPEEEIFLTVKNRASGNSQGLIIKMQYSEV